MPRETSSFIDIMISALNPDNNDGPRAYIYDELQCKIKGNPNNEQLKVLLANIVPFWKILKNYKIPRLPGKENYIDIESEEYPPHNLSISINIHPSNLNWVMEQVSNRYKVEYSGLVLKKAFPHGIDSILNTDIGRIIRRNLNNESGYPVAMIHPDGHPKAGTFVILCEVNDYRNQARLSEFQWEIQKLCMEHDIPVMREGFPHIDIVDSGDRNIPIRYEFNISPDNLDKLLLDTCSSYVGYRSGSSILRLANPTMIDYKPNTMCLFPLLPLEDGQYMLRTAGCNISETISTQLANFIDQHLLQGKSSNKDLYSHHGAPLVSKELNVDNFMILDAAARCIGLNKRIDHQSESGFTTFQLESNKSQYLKPMQDEAEGIHRRLGVLNPVELKTLQSFEVPIVKYLDELISLLQERITFNNKSDTLNIALVKRYSDAYEKCVELRAAISGLTPETKSIEDPIDSFSQQRTTQNEWKGLIDKSSNADLNYLRRLDMFIENFEMVCNSSYKELGDKDLIEILPTPLDLPRADDYLKMDEEAKAHVNTWLTQGEEAIEKILTNRPLPPLP